MSALLRCDLLPSEINEPESSVSAVGAVPSTLHRQARDLVVDLHAPKPLIYWSDYLAASGFGWVFFALAVYLPWLSPLMVLSAVLSALLHYRALLFVHEISHFSRGRWAGFEVAWNALSGIPLLLPSFVYCGVHQDHHRISCYGTARDPEYMPFARSRARTTVFLIESVFIPLALLIRFILLSPVGLIWPAFHRWLAVHGSSLVINVFYCRDTAGGLEQRMRPMELIILGVWSAAVVAAYRGILPWRLFAVWFAVVATVSFVNTLRTLVAHDYESDGQPMDRAAQLTDSIDHPGGWWTELWAPVGLRYHALHHYFPGIPYHNLGKAYRRLIAQLPAASAYRNSTNSSLPYSMRELYRKGAVRPRGV